MYLRTKETPVLQPEVPSPLAPKFQRRVLDLIDDLKTSDFKWDMSSGLLPDLPCGTPGCIAGHLAAHHSFLRYKGSILWIDCGVYLGLDGAQADDLFYTSLRCLSTISRDAAISVLQNYYHTGKIKWPRNLY